MRIQFLCNGCIVHPSLSYVNAFLAAIIIAYATVAFAYIRRTHTQRFIWMIWCIMIFLRCSNRSLLYGVFLEGDHFFLPSADLNIKKKKI